MKGAKDFIMTQRHVWYIKDKYFKQHKNGDKDIEVRVGYSSVKKVKQGDTLVFANHDSDEFEVVRVAVYPSFEAMLKKKIVGVSCPEPVLRKP